LISDAELAGIGLVKGQDKHKVQFIKAYTEVRKLINASIKEYIEVETRVRALETKIILAEDVTSNIDQSTWKLKNLEQRLGALVDLDEQLFLSIHRSPSLNGRSQIFARKINRLRYHTSLGRLASLGALPTNSSMNPI
jgi:hypothetical protein